MLLPEKRGEGKGVYLAQKWMVVRNGGSDNWFVPNEAKLTDSLP